ncbi:putative hydro-lyase [Pelagibius sp. Alg239-R121]|uniref:putative hydro-lyase n=1 Tax=Pelagibius sp. Alg239-R121 TaxID=2993448 RepID=UPI0024A6675B|nr:putative hydro-lyase [Pelagibius sp. Alg239-R121]
MKAAIQFDYSTQGQAVRQSARSGDLSGHTSGLARGNLQGNVVILPSSHAGSFLQYCLNNPKPCPLIGVSALGDPALPSLGRDIDIRTDLPRYRVFHNGVYDEETTNIVELWSDDFMTFVIGCSFTFEQALQDNGVAVRNIDDELNVPMFRTNIETMPAGPFCGPLIVTMRPVKTELVPAAFEATRPFTHSHGVPIHVGAASDLGIADLDKPDFGDAIEVAEGEVPVFWACGVTPQLALGVAKPPICITHSPGSMLVTDLNGDEPPTVDFPFSMITTNK